MNRNYPISAAWLAHRRLRRLRYSVAGRNPLVGLAHAPTLLEEWRSIVNMLEARRSPPRLVRNGRPGVWQTCVGEMAAPPGVYSDFVRVTAEEQAFNVYALGAEDKIVVDGGANVGFFTRFALSMGAVRVIAFEPASDNVACFKHNFAKEIVDGRVVLVEKGIWDYEGECRFSTATTEYPASYAITEGGNVSIPVTSLDRALADLDVGRVDFIKLDIEGAETRAIEGALQTIAAFRPRLSIATEHTDDHFANAAAVISRLDGLGYDYLCTQSAPEHSVSRGAVVMTPECVHFTPRPVSI